MIESCEIIKDRLIDYVNHGLSKKDYKKVTMHLSRCEDCRNELDDIIAISKQASLQMVDVPEDIKVSAFEKIPQKEKNITPTEKVPLKKESLNTTSEKTTILAVPATYIWRHIMKKRSIIAACVAMFIVASIASVYYILPLIYDLNSPQSIILARSKTDLLLESDLIIRGVVRGGSTREWSNLENIYTYIDVKDVYKGQPYDSRIRIRVRGTKRNNPDATEFSNGEEVLLFLEDSDKGIVNSNNPNEKYYILNGSSQAVYTFDKNEGSDRIFKNIFESVHKFNLSTIKDEINHAKENPRKIYTQEEMDEYNRIGETGTKEEMEEANMKMWLLR